MTYLLLALAPVLIILVYIYIRDKYEKEPFLLLLTSLIAGGFTIIPVIFIEEWLGNYALRYSGIQIAAFEAFIVAGFTEEFFKFLALFFLIWRSREFNEKFDGIVYAVFISLGFAAVENVIYLVEYGPGTGFTRALTAIPAHAIFGITMGYYFSIAKFRPGKKYYGFGLALVMPVLLHGIYDFILMSQLEMYLLFFVVYLFLLWRWGFKKLREINLV
jgi:protease PrsW